MLAWTVWPALEPGTGGLGKILSCLIQGNFVSSAESSILWTQGYPKNNRYWSWVPEFTFNNPQSLSSIRLKLPVGDGG